MFDLATHSSTDAPVFAQWRQSPAGFSALYGHYGGVAIDGSGRLYAVWGGGSPDYRTGSVWFNSVDLAYAVRK